MVIMMMMIVIIVIIIGLIQFLHRIISMSLATAALTSFSLLVIWKMGDGGGGHWLVQMEWRPAGWSVCLRLLIFPCAIKSKSSLLAPAHPGGPIKRAAKRLWWC